MLGELDQVNRQQLQGPMFAARGCVRTSSGGGFITGLRVGSQQYLRLPELARRMPASAQKRVSSPRSAWLSSIRWRTFIVNLLVHTSGKLRAASIAHPAKQFAMQRLNRKIRRVA